MSKPVYNLVLVLGDQLDRRSSAFDSLSKRDDTVLMAEVSAEAEYVWSTKARIAMFFSAMRHFELSLRKEDIQVDYHRIDDSKNIDTLSKALQYSVKLNKPQKVIVAEPGEYRVKKMLTEACKALRVPLEIRPDRSFFCSIDQFTDYASPRRQLRMEFFYRQMRKKIDVLMEDNKPVGGKWNYDTENRKPFGVKGTVNLSRPVSFPPDKITAEVITMVKKRFAQHPGGLDHFDWPVTATQADKALKEFLKNRLAQFGTYQDAMYLNEPFLYHSRLSAALNLKLLDPRKVINLTAQAYQAGRIALNSAEGFIRQILGWREYVRGIYWHYMPDYLEMNQLQATLDLPGFYWTGQTEAQCLSEVINQTLEYGYAHHIQRLMVTGLFALLLGVRPREVHKWYLAVYVDAIEWVELPNTLGMSQYGDGGIMASKPYIATGKYIQRMSNYCKQCKYNPNEKIGPTACPFTTLYWDFLIRHKKKLFKNPRMTFQVRNVESFSPSQKREINKQAENVRQRCFA